MFVICTGNPVDDSRKTQNQDCMPFTDQHDAVEEAENRCGPADWWIVSIKSVTELD